jgi:hypothetical protein
MAFSLQVVDRATLLFGFGILMVAMASAREQFRTAEYRLLEQRSAAGARLAHGLYATTSAAVTLTG